MATCPKCEKRLTKNKKGNFYYCVYHGFVRKIYNGKSDDRKE